MRKTLSIAEKKVLRAKSYSLKPVVLIVQRGISDAVLSEIETALESHELMKVRFGGLIEKSVKNWQALFRDQPVRSWFTR